MKSSASRAATQWNHRWNWQRTLGIAWVFHRAPTMWLQRNCRAALAPLSPFSQMGSPDTCHSACSLPASAVSMVKPAECLEILNSFYSFDLAEDRSLRGSNPTRDIFQSSPGSPRSWVLRSCKWFYHQNFIQHFRTQLPEGERRLAAIMFTDVVGYTLISSLDESRALKLLEEHQNILKSIFPKFDGQVVKTMGTAFSSSSRARSRPSTAPSRPNKKLEERTRGGEKRTR